MNESVLVFYLLVLLVLYFLPSLIAILRQRTNNRRQRLGCAPTGNRRTGNAASLPNGIWSVILVELAANVWSRF